MQSEARLEPGRVQELIADVEALIDQVAETADPEVRRLRTRVSDALDAARASLSAGADYAQQQTRAALRNSDRYVRRHPWESIGIAALVGVAIGVLVSVARRQESP